MLTDDPNHPGVKRGCADKEQVEQHEVYLVLSDEELKEGFIRPVRDSYIHNTCGVETKMNLKIAETYARNPYFYGLTYCIHCKKHLPVSEFIWSKDGTVVGS